MDRKAIKRKVHFRIRKKVKGTADRPRLAVNFSNMHIYAQIIDDVAGHTLASASTLSKDAGIKGTTLEKAKQIGEIIGEKAKKEKINKVVFDRGGIRYHGKIAALADSVREKGIIF